MHTMPNTTYEKYVELCTCCSEENGLIYMLLVQGVELAPGLQLNTSHTAQSLASGRVWMMPGHDT